MRQGVLELFGQDHFLDLPWNLAACDPNASDFKSPQVRHQPMSALRGKADIRMSQRLYIATQSCYTTGVTSKYYCYISGV